MLGWEFPPFISGGLGTACQGLTRAMTRLGTRILFVLPKAGETPAEGQAQFPVAPTWTGNPGRLTFRAVFSEITDPYRASQQRADAGVPPAPEKARTLSASRLSDEPSLEVVGVGAGDGYDGDLIRRIADYAARCERVVEGEDFDVVHGHDWVTFPAAMAIAARFGKPLVLHVHSTEFDRSGEQVNRPVYEIERAGVHAASAVIAVSHLTKRILVERYDVAPDKVRVVHNGIEAPESSVPPIPANGANGDIKTVLFLGRITMQKGPEYFVRAAARVLEKLEDVRFLVVGWGDMGPSMVEQVAAMGLGRNVRFTGFLRGGDVERAYRMSNVYAMPSVSEPFGLTALEAIRYGVPVVLSKSSGAAEVLHRGALKVDYWDVDDMANKIVAVLKRSDLAEALRHHGFSEIRGLTWERAGRACLQVYREKISA
jgi:glycogen(starch) synthase